jgi:hypothetical protein
VQYSLIQYPFGASFSFGPPTDKASDSNAVYLSFGNVAPPPPVVPDSQSSGDGDNQELIIGLTVDLVLLAVLVAGALLMQWRWRRGHKRQSEGAGASTWKASLMKRSRWRGRGGSSWCSAVTCSGEGQVYRTGREGTWLHCAYGRPRAILLAEARDSLVRTRRSRACQQLDDAIHVRASAASG